MKRGFSAAGPVVARCCTCDRAYGPRSGPPAEFASIDEAMDFFIDGADGFELYEGRVFCPFCLYCGGCESPVPTWSFFTEPVSGGRTLVGRRCIVCGLFVEVLA